MNCGRMTPRTGPHGAWLTSTVDQATVILVDTCPYSLVTPSISMLNVATLVEMNCGHTTRPTTLHGLLLILPRVVAGATLVRL